MSDSLFYIIIAVAGIGLLVVMIWYFMLSKRFSKEEIPSIINATMRAINREKNNEKEKDR